MNQTFYRWLLLVGLLTTLWTTTFFPMSAQQEDTAVDIDIITNLARVDFPNEVTFYLEWTPGPDIVDAVLVYDVEQASCLEAVAQVPVELDGTSIEWTWVMSRSGNPPPGTTLWWEWRLTDANGNNFTTLRQELTFTDDRYEWRTVEAGKIRLHWYRGDDVVGNTLLEAAVAGLDRLQNEMGIELRDEVQIFIYGNSADMQGAVLYIQDWAGGVAFSEYNVILIGVPPNIVEDWGRKTVRHELAHLVIGQFGSSCFGGSNPTWLSEGLAVFAEGELDGDFKEALDIAFRDNQFEPVRSLNGAFPADNDEALLAYAQSFSVVNFMLSEFGQEKIQELLLKLAQGSGYDESLEEVYGFNVDGLELLWREAIGAPTRTIPPTPTPILAANIPTIVPLGMPGDLPTPPAAAELPVSRPEPSSGNCGLGMIPLLLLGVIGLKISGKKKR